MDIRERLVGRDEQNVLSKVGKEVLSQIECYGKEDTDNFEKQLMRTEYLMNFSKFFSDYEKNIAILQQAMIILESNETDRKSENAAYSILKKVGGNGQEVSVIEIIEKVKVAKELGKKLESEENYQSMIPYKKELDQIIAEAFGKLDLSDKEEKVEALGIIKNIHLFIRDYKSNISILNGIAGIEKVVQAKKSATQEEER